MLLFVCITILCEDVTVEYDPQPKNRFSRLGLFFVIGSFMWTATIGIFFDWQFRQINTTTLELAHKEANANFNKDQAFRFWATMHGGVYVPVTEKTSPSPYLAHISERDITTPSGRHLTLMNPAYIMRQLNEQQDKLMGIRGHITSLKPIRPENAPDEWERAALTKFEQGVSEVVDVSTLDGQPYLRFMRPMLAQEGCLKCHGHQGYSVGEVRGGVSVAVPLAPYFSREQANVYAAGISLAVIWLLGTGGLVSGYRRLSRDARRQAEAAEEIRQLNVGLELRVGERTAELAAANDDLRQVRDQLEQRIEEQTHTEAAIRESRALLKAITDSLVEGVVVADAHGSLLFANPSATHLLECGTTPEGMEGLPLDAVLRVESGSPVAFADSPWKRVLMENTAIRSDDAVFILASGKTLSVAYACAPLADGDEQRSLVVSFRDIGKLKEAQREALQSSRLASVGQLAAGIAHEINTPTQYIGDNLAYIRDSLAILQRGIEAGRQMADQAAGHLEMAETLARFREMVAAAKVERTLTELPDAVAESLEGVAQISRIVLSMKEFSHPGMTAKTATDINRAIENTLTVSRNAWKHVAEIERDFDPALPPVVCHAGEMNQVFLNLILNAAQAIGGAGKPLPGRITITTRPANDHAEIIMTDSGTGVPVSIRERIFDPFFTTKDVGKGTGQGLAICRDVVVAKHGGSIDVGGQEGEGAVFTVRIPLDGDVRTPDDP